MGAIQHSTQCTSPSPSTQHSHFIASSHRLQALRAWEPAPSFTFSSGDGTLRHTPGEAHFKGCGNTTTTSSCCFQRHGCTLWTAAGAPALEHSSMEFPRCISNTSSTVISATPQHSERRKQQPKWPFLAVEHAALCLHGNQGMNSGLTSHHSKITDALLSVFFYNWKWKVLTIHGWCEYMSIWVSKKTQASYCDG